MNRKNRRASQFVKNRLFTKKGYAFGHKIGGTTLALAEHFHKKEERDAGPHQ